MAKINKKSIDFEPRLPENQSVNNLILFCLYSATEKTEKCTFERLVKECFALFPETFSFFEYHNWPDSRKLDRPLRFLRKQRLILGQPKSGFLLTKSGKSIAEAMIKIMRQRKLKI